ncbi:MULTISPECIES: helix-turn-helix transcriptional regulator [Acinetobacter]|uniref:WYL domain-containing protein n=1 Tax=Acinetobacter pecorum TaxID=2762215 RepID=A0ABR8VTL8_9GAMM|nr:MULTISPECIES: WYL domain-containing protein [Acinetobacter]MBD8008101.1 WYL domain-containing protein [Acinetobacter pecorum]OAL82976.1 DNA-binding transcriptional regulator [Acinetobacter sp. SFA]OAL84992.1 DNA-binding transcriptional regulator [Acinetobacter sp. SFD]
MKGNASTHERLAERLASILTKLNIGHQLNVQELAREFQVSTRTIERDFDRLNSYLPLIQDEHTKRYYLEPSYLGRFKLQDIQNFAQLSGISDLYPTLDMSFIRELLDERANQVFSAKGYYFEDAKQFAEHFKLLAGAIYKRQQIELLYSDQVRIIQPYRLIHHHGIWYLAGVIQGELKTYRLSQLQQVKLVFKAESFEHDSEVLKMLTDEDSIWFGRQKQQVLVKVQPAVTVFFKERRLFPEQQIEQELESGELLISCQIRHEMQLLPLVRYWLPYVKIIEPIHFQQKLEQDLQGYLRSAG